MNAVMFSLDGAAEISVKYAAYVRVLDWYADGMISRPVYRRADDLAARCSTELGDEMPDNDQTHGKISAWLRNAIGNLE